MIGAHPYLIYERTTMTTSLEIEEKALGSMISPVFTFESILNWQNLSAEDLQDKVILHEILELETSEGKKVFPAWQFNPDGSVNANILKVVRILSAFAEPWTVALWLAVSMDEKDTKNLQPIYADLLSNRNVDDIVLCAQMDAARWRD